MEETTAGFLEANLHEFPRNRRCSRFVCSFPGIFGNRSHLKDEFTVLSNVPIHFVRPAALTTAQSRKVELKNSSLLLFVCVFQLDFG